MLEHELNSNNHHQGCLDMDQIPIIIIKDASIILDDDDWDFINVQASMMMNIGIWSMYKHTW